MNKKNHYIVFCITMVLPTFVWAAKSDFEQPINLDADEIEVDFSTGERVYHGNVVFTQGSTRLHCDQLSTVDVDGSLGNAICVGSLAKFQQRPEGADNDIVGVAQTIDVDYVARLVVLKNQAEISQADKTLSGEVITYNMDTSKVRMVGQKNNRASAEIQSSNQTSEGSQRPKLIIQPRNSQQSESNDS